MKKTIIAAIVGGLIIFFVQFFAWTLLQMHYKSQAYTPKQDSILAYLNTQELNSGQYLMPTVPPGSTSAEMQKNANNNMGKPWAVVAYHKAQNTNMGMSMLRVFLVNVVVVFFMAWILVKIPSPLFSTIFIASLLVGAIVYLNSTYTYHIWYQTPGQKGYIIEGLAQWGLTGAWLGWWLRRK